MKWTVHLYYFSHSIIYEVKFHVNSTTTNLTLEILYANCIFDLDILPICACDLDAYDLDIYDLDMWPKFMTYAT